MTSGINDLMLHVVEETNRSHEAINAAWQKTLKEVVEKLSTPAASKVLVLFQEWDHAYEMSCMAESEEECDKWTDAYMRIEKEMLSIPSTSAADFAAKVIAHTVYASCSIITESGGHELLEEAISLTGGKRQSR